MHNISTPNNKQDTSGYTWVYKSAASNIYEPHLTLQKTNQNSFAHLRNQISNLRTQFSRLVKKDNYNVNQKSQNDSIVERIKKQQYYRQQSESKIDNNYLNCQSKGYVMKNISQIQKENTNQYKGGNYQHIGKKSTSKDKCTLSGMINIKGNNINLQYQKQQKSQMLQEINNSQYYQNEINRLKQKSAAQQQICNEQIKSLKKQLEKWKENFKNISISLAMKNELIDQLQACLKRKTQEKLILTEEVNSLQSQNFALKQKNILFQSQSNQKNFQKNIINNYPTESAKKEKADSIQLQHELIDLRKRVDSYRKSIEQLNSTHNLTRQKLASARQEIKKLMAQKISFERQIKELTQEQIIKQKLINNLYQDINLFDKQIKQIHHLKQEVLMSYSSIEILNQIIIQLRCQLCNQKIQRDQAKLQR